MICKSFPWCREEAAPGDFFCAQHRQHLENAKEALNRRSKSASAVRPPAPVTVKQMHPQWRREQYKTAILEALKDGKCLTGKELAAAVGSSKDRTFQRARNALLEDELITKTTGEASAQKYSLAAVEHPKATESNAAA
jgi:hypothetical protein